MDKDLWMSLRGEISFLKSCQINYFTFSIAAAGAVAGFGESGALKDAGATTLLAPLLVVIPCSLIFFDKATTISRIVGFLRFLEPLLLSPDPATDGGLTHGWELSLEKYRKLENKDSYCARFKNYVFGFGYGVGCLPMFTTSHKYWVINWYTFTVLSAVSLWLARPHNDGNPDAVWMLAMAATVLVASHNLTVLGRLTNGSYSYEACFQRWSEALRVDSPGESTTPA